MMCTVWQALEHSAVNGMPLSDPSPQGSEIHVKELGGRGGTSFQTRAASRRNRTDPHMNSQHMTARDSTWQRGLSRVTAPREGSAHPNHCTGYFWERETQFLQCNVTWYISHTPGQDPCLELTHQHYMDFMAFVCFLVSLVFYCLFYFHFENLSALIFILSLSPCCCCCFEVRRIWEKLGEEKVNDSKEISIFLI